MKTKLAVLIFLTMAVPLLANTGHDSCEISVPDTVGYENGSGAEEMTYPEPPPPGSTQIKYCQWLYNFNYEACCTRRGFNACFGGPIMVNPIASICAVKAGIAFCQCIHDPN